MTMNNTQNLLKTAIVAALQAGRDIIHIYNDPAQDFGIEKKADNSPLTLADKAAHHRIMGFLEPTGIPVLSEEGRHLPFEERSAWDCLWVVDPLDGTKEFIKKNGEFTVNIALVRNQIPVMGVIYVPAKDLLYWGSGEGAFKATVTCGEAFPDVDENLSISVKPNPIPAESTAEMSFTVTADREIWGKNTYHATPVVDGKVYKGSDGKSAIGIWAFTKENFSHLTQDEKAKGPRPTFKESTYSFGKIKRGDSVHASFTFKNDGKEPFCVYKVNSDAPCWSHSRIEVASPGEEVTFRFHLDTTDLPVGEHLTFVTLTTNSPLRPIVNLFVAGYIE